MTPFRFIISFFLFFIFLSGMRAQVPGYLGKRFIIHAEGISSPTLSNPSFNNRAFLSSGRFRDGNGWLGINARYSLEASYVVGRNMALFASYDRQRTGMETHAFNGGNLRDQQFYEMQGRAFTIGLKSFSSQKGALAPFGSYTGIHLTQMRMEGTLIQSFRGNDRVDATAASYGVSPQAGYFLGGMEFGLNYILFDRMVVNVSWQANVPFDLIRLASWFGGIDYVGDAFSIPERNQAIFEQSVFSRITGQSLFLMQVGVGYLLF